MELKTLPQDIYNLFNPETSHEISEENLDAFTEATRSILRSRLRGRSASESSLRFSSLGKPNRQQWYDAHPDGTEEKLTGKTLLKFLYGDIIETLLVFLIREAGHEVTDEQKEVEVDGVKGHIDCIVDGVVVDIKSASSIGYQKFERNTILSDDPFGYVPQLSGYASVLTPNRDAAWIAMDKVSGDICVAPLSSAVIEHYKPAERIAELKEVISSDEVPPLCYDPVPDGKSGNLKLPTSCSYCRHKFRCHPGIRTFLYSTGPRFLTEVVKTPDVMEIT